MFNRTATATTIATLLTTAAQAAEPPVLVAHGQPTALVQLGRDLLDAQVRPVRLAALRGCGRPGSSEDCHPLHTAYDSSGEHSVILPVSHLGRPYVFAFGEAVAVAHLKQLMPEVDVLRVSSPWCPAQGCFEAWMPEEEVAAPCQWEPTASVVLLSQDLPAAIVGDLCLSHGLSVRGPETTLVGPPSPETYKLPAVGGPLGPTGVHSGGRVAIPTEAESQPVRDPQ